jgi:hypothetical protein
VAERMAWLEEIPTDSTSLYEFDSLIGEHCITFSSRFRNFRSSNILSPPSLHAYSAATDEERSIVYAPFLHCRVILLAGVQNVQIKADEGHMRIRSGMIVTTEGSQIGP